MIFFPGGQLDGVKSGAITVTFRVWDRARVKAGSLQRSHPIGVVAIDEVTAVSLGAITVKDAKLAGFTRRAALVASLEEKAGEALAPDDEVWRVAFRFVGDADHAANALDTDLSGADVIAITRALATYDASSGIGAWTAKTMKLIATSPKIAASALAKSLGRDTPSFKADVLKLKKLGLTQSFSAGYAISPRGAAYLSRVSRASRASASRKSGVKTPSTRTE